MYKTPREIKSNLIYIVVKTPKKLLYFMRFSTNRHNDDSP